MADSTATARPHSRHRWLPLITLVLALSACDRLSAYMNVYLHPFTAQTPLADLSEPGVAPRRINLKAFDPHRDPAQFVCRRQDERLPAITPAAQALHEQALALTSPALWPNQRNWPRAMELWSEATRQGHWKAGLMLLQLTRTGDGINSEKGQFRVEPRPAEQVLVLTEVLIRQGVPDAFYLMGRYFDDGYGVRPDTDRAWAFYELAADLGSPRAQTKIAKVLGLADRSMEKEYRFRGEWSNPKMESLLLECAYAQGHGQAAYLLPAGPSGG